MMFRLLTLVLVGLITFAGCSESDDPVLAPAPPRSPDPPTFQDLSEKAHVIDNLVLAYNQRVPEEVDSLLDTGFTFLFSSADVSSYGFPSSWNRADEMIASTAILGDGVTGPDSIVSIDLAIPYDTLHWDTSPFHGPGGIDTLYVTTLHYSYVFTTAGHTSYITSGSNEAIFAVWNTGTRDEPSWRLVRWDDLGSTARSAGDTENSSAIEVVSWGWVKERYHPQIELSSPENRLGS